jgi:hypothetical protein
MKPSLVRVAFPLAAIWGWVAPGCDSVRAQPLQTIVTRQGDQLIEDGRPFRFISFNLPNLQMIEDNFALDAKSPWRLPDEFEIADALETVRQMGGTAVRTYVLSVRRDDSDMGDDVYVLGPGKFNEEAFRTLDLVLDVARRKGVRVIIPLVDNWKWQGGRGEYAGFHGLKPDDFWTDEAVIQDFEKTVRHVVGRVNTRSGAPYKDDPAILCWETGNELDSTPAWTRRIAALVKSIDPNHLVMDGYSLHGVRQESLDDPNVDVVTTHHYPDHRGAHFVEPIRAAREATRGKKPLVVGEFGFCPTDEATRVFDAVIDEGIAGALIWSLRFRSREGGFYWHFEPAGGEKYKAYHWPGFASGESYDERNLLAVMRAKAFAVRGLAEPPIATPGPPALLPIADPAAISWQGSVGAESYDVERAESGEGPWKTIAPGVDEAAVQYRPLFADESAEPGTSYFYRVRAVNRSGNSAPSNVVGPVKVACRALVDECGSLAAKAAAHAGPVSLSVGKDRRRREDVSRIEISPGGSVTYEVAEPVASWSAIVFHERADARCVVESSSDGKAFSPVDSRRVVLGEGPGDYGYLHAAILESGAAPAEARFLRFSTPAATGEAEGGGPVELSRVEIRYGAAK